MRMNADNGNLGISTINPLCRLDVRGGAITNRMTQNATGAFMEGTAEGNAYFGSLGGGTVSLGNSTTRQILNVIENGNVGIGTTAPQRKLDVRGGMISTQDQPSFSAAFMQGDAQTAYFGSLGTTTVSIGNSSNWQALNVIHNGNVGIGSIVPKYKLAVNGVIGAIKIKVTQDNWPVYVFEDNYQLPSLKEVEQYILQNKHLPGVLSAADVKEYGLDPGDNQSALLKKIEELTLCAIDQDKKINTQ